MGGHYLYQTLRVYGKVDELGNFYEANRNSTEKSQLSFEKLIPTTIIHAWNHKYIQKKVDYEGEIIPTVPLPNTVDFYRILWGTHSNAAHVEVDMDKEKGILTYHFRTKEYAPMIWYHTLASTYKKMKFEVEISVEDSPEWIHKMIFENGMIVKSVKYNCVEEFYQKQGGMNLVFDKIIVYMKSKNIDYHKYMKKIYDKHQKHCEGVIENIDYQGVVEDFVEKTKLEKCIDKVYEKDDSKFYFYSKEFIQYIFQLKE